MTQNNTAKQTHKNQPIEIKETEESALIAAALGVFRPGTQSSADFFNQNLPLRHPARVSRQTVWNWVTGTYKPREAVLRAWRVFYGVDDARHKLAARIEKLRAEHEARWIGAAPSALRASPPKSAILGEKLEAA